MSGAAGAWVQATTFLGGNPNVAAATAVELVERYGEPHRHYHTTTHVEAVLRDAAQLARELDLTERERAVLALAACAHDVVYNTQPGMDEEASARWAHDHLLRAGLPGDAVERVAQLVLLTLDHKVNEDDVVGAALLDADLAILGTPRDVYDRYTAAVRGEFAAVPDDLWRLGRAHVLRSLQARPQLYLTAPARERWETAAQANLARELLTLEP